MAHGVASTGLSLPFHGWRVVAAASGIMVFSAGLGYFGIGVYIRTLHAQLGWSISALSAAASGAQLLTGVVFALLPDLHSRFGIVATTRAGGLCLAAGALAWSSAASPWGLGLAAALTGIGSGACSTVLAFAIIAPWFDRKRPAANALAVNGFALGGLLLVPAWVLLIDAVGFQSAAMLLGGTAFGVIMVLAGPRIRLTPASLGQHPDGVPPVATRRAAEPDTGPPLARVALLRDRGFLTLMAAFALGLSVHIGLFAHLLVALAPILGERGSALAVSLTTLSIIGGRTVFAWYQSGPGATSDRRIAAAALLSLQACALGLLALAVSEGVRGAAALAAGGCVLFGLGASNLAPMVPNIVQVEYRRTDVQRVVSFAFALAQPAGALGPGAIGALRDLSGGYPAPLALAVMVQAASAAVILVGRRARTAAG
ncbi:MFS transporter [Elioraea rosea]|uniref:MFS transporter n=1 Tax=Elioraea rosea TaxID=2492390 RepID=UPI00118378FF|nr:MFS transporter [Elioraea rosea]